MTLPETFLPAVAVGIGATAVMDLWLLLLRRLGAATLNFAMIGRWVGHLARGRLAHEAISRAPVIRHELALGWATHYAIGIAFALLLVELTGPVWLQTPTVAPALLLGMATVSAPLLVMQPAMGAGIASRKTPTPLRNSLRSLANHTAFGLGLYLAALPLAWLAR